MIQVVLMHDMIRIFSYMFLRYNGHAYDDLSNIAPITFAGIDTYHFNKYMIIYHIFVPAKVVGSIISSFVSVGYNAHV